ncbi:unnamed protein product [Symbiodinium sp. CCMP2592]|nr:unnamed protein product [Symbiodinium sp. CCMP2592]
MVQFLHVREERGAGISGSWSSCHAGISCCGLGDADAASGGEDHKPRADTASTAVVSSSAGHTSTSLEGVEGVAWETVAFRQDLWPLRSYAHHPEDIPLISKFLELTPLTSIVPAAGKLLLRVLRFLHMCDYRLEDICAILAHASAYFMDVYSQCAGMQATEVGHILATLIFIAHCYVQDETCPLNIWQKHLFKKYCSLKTLNSAVIRLLEIRRYRLRLPQDDLWKRLEALASSIAMCTSIDTSFGRQPPPSSGSRSTTSYGMTMLRSVGIALMPRQVPQLLKHRSPKVANPCIRNQDVP